MTSEPITAVNFNSSTSFENFYRWDSIKWTSVMLQLSVLVVGPLLLGSILWYEKCGCHAVQRTILSCIVANTCICHIVLCLPTVAAFILGNKNNKTISFDPNYSYVFLLQVSRMLRIPVSLYFLLA